MAEPENHTLHLLREIREALRAAQSEARERFDRLEQRLESVRKAALGESVLGRYAVADVEERPDELDRRVSALEEAR